MKFTCVQKIVNDNIFKRIVDLITFVREINYSKARIWPIFYSDEYEDVFLKLPSQKLPFGLFFPILSFDIMYTVYCTCQ